MVAELRLPPVAVEAGHIVQAPDVPSSDGRAIFFTEPTQSDLSLSWGAYPPNVTPIQWGNETLAPVVNLQHKDRNAYEHAYATLVCGLGFVKGVYVDQMDGLTISTIYEGNFRDVTDILYEIYDRVESSFPECLVKHRLIRAANNGDYSPPVNARRLV